MRFGGQSLKGVQLLLLVILITYAAAQRTRANRARTYCTINPVDQYVTMYMLLVFNGDPVEKVLVIDGSVYSGSNEATGCSVQTLAGGRRLIESSMYTDGRARNNACGARFTATGTDFVFRWDVELRELFSSGLYTEIDSHYVLTCSSDRLSPGVVSANVFAGELLPVTGEQLRPVTQMRHLVLDGQGQFNPPAVDLGVRVNENIRLQIFTRLSQPSDQISFLGVYPFSCSVYTAPGASTPASFIGENGCSTGQFPLTRGFARSRFESGVFYTETESFPLYSSNPPGPIYVIECNARYCFQETDPKCDDYCTYNTGRRRRNAESPMIEETVSLTIRLADFNTTTTGTEDTDSDAANSTPVAMIAALSVVSAVGLVALVLGILICLYRRREEQQRKQKPAYLNFGDIPVKQ